MDIQNEIIKAIDIIVEKKLEKSNISTDVGSVIQDVDGDKYLVSISGSKTWVKCGVELYSLHIGVPVWVHIPNGNIQNAFIIAYRK